MVRRKSIPRRTKTEASREFPRHILATNHRPSRRTHPPLHAGRARSSLDGRSVLRLLSDHRFGLLVPIHVLARGTGWRRADGAFLASVAWRLHSPCSGCTRCGAATWLRPKPTCAGGRRSTITSRTTTRIFLLRAVSTTDRKSFSG